MIETDCGYTTTFLEHFLRLSRQFWTSGGRMDSVMLFSPTAHGVRNVAARAKQRGQKVLCRRGEGGFYT